MSDFLKLTVIYGMTIGGPTTPASNSAVHRRRKAAANPSPAITPTERTTGRRRREPISSSPAPLPSTEAPPSHMDLAASGSDGLASTLNFMPLILASTVNFMPLTNLVDSGNDVLW